MQMPPYLIYCCTPDCGRLAVYKIAARWSDGVAEDLKTYALVCADCVYSRYLGSREKQSMCPLAPGETLELPGIYELVRGLRDRQLPRRYDLERSITS